MCFQLIHFLPNVGSHLSWLETEYKAGILMTVTPHPPPPSPSLFLPLSHLHPLHLSSLHILYNLSAQLISCLLSLSPLFTLLISALSRCSCISPTQISLPPLLSFYPSLHLTSLYLSRCSVYHLPATLSSSIPPPSCLFSACISTNSSFHFASSIPPHPACPFHFGFLLPLI